MKGYNITKLLLTFTALLFSISASFGTQLNESKKNTPLTTTRWQLVELMGKPVTPGEKEPYIVFKNEDHESGNALSASGSVSGDGGCNSFQGQYTLKGDTRIEFKSIATTLMACSTGMETEKELLEIIEKTDSYSIKENELQLYRARMAPLAKFIAVISK